jgi:hypothetical protein
MLCLDDCFATTTMPQATEITQFIFGQPLRRGAMLLHPSPMIEWLDDSLPDLAAVRARKEEFDLVMLTAVWMHLDEAQRQRAMPNVSALVRNGGVVIMSLRHGPIPPGRRMFEVSAEETMALAQRSSLSCILNREAEPSLRQPGVSWTRLAFHKLNRKQAGCS